MDVETKTIRRWFLFASTVLIASCGGKSEDQPAPAPNAVEPAVGDPIATAKQMFAQRCTPCHGATGQGDGPASASLVPQPRKYADSSWQASVTDADLEKIIKYGGAAVGKSPAMPSNPDLKPEIVTALKDLIRAFATK